MSIKVYNKNTKQSSVCERPDWTKCRDHNPNKGWSVQPFNRKLDNDALLVPVKETTNSSYTVEQYNVEAESQLMSPEYNKRAAELREQNFKTIREKGLGSNFDVLNPSDSGRKDNIVWVGTCSRCGERVFNRKDKGLWEHEVDVVAGKSITNLQCVKAAELLGNKGRDETIVPSDKTDSVINIGWAFNVADKIKNTVNVNVSNKTNINFETPVKSHDLRCKGFTAQGTPCTLGVAPEYSNEYCHQHYKQGFSDTV